MALLAVASRAAVQTALASVVAALVRLAATKVATMVVRGVREAHWEVWTEEAPTGVDATAAMATASATQVASTAGKGVVASRVEPVDVVMAVGYSVVERRVVVSAGWTVAESTAEASMGEV